MVWLRSLFVLLSVMSGRVSAAIGPKAVLRIENANVSPDGFTRIATLANGGVPGPVITGNKGDIFSIDVQNQLADHSLDVVTSIHWHGIFHTNHNYADGGAFVNQCPIVPDDSFTYVFPTFEQTGTYWYHSHYQAQYCDGLRGALVIYDPNDPQASLYDVDDESTIITLADWYHYSSLQAPLAPEFNSTLINGVGRYSGGPSVDLAVVNVVFERRYRLRLVSISCGPSFNFSIDSHTMTIIEVDGVDHQPLAVDSLQIFAGQRYSVVLGTNQLINNYWIRAVPNLGNQDFIGLTNLAVLRYFGAFPTNPPVNPTEDVPESVLSLIETNLHPLDPIPVPGNPVPGGADINIDLYVALESTVSSFHTTNDSPTNEQSADFTQFLVNNVAYESPSVPVLLQILNGASAPELLPNGSIYTLGRNQSVEITFPCGAGGINTGGPHPLHLHGHVFHVVRSAGNSTYNFDNPVIRDVVSVGDMNDDVTIRFQTDNPGPWFLHCHIDWHLKKGFVVVMAENVPDVPTAVNPPGESKRVFLEFSRTGHSSRFVERTLLKLHHLCQRQLHEVDSLASAK
jgi:iron transport multicopper oxidase